MQQTSQHEHTLRACETKILGTEVNDLGHAFWYKLLLVIMKSHSSTLSIIGSKYGYQAAFFKSSLNGQSHSL